MAKSINTFLRNTPQEQLLKFLTWSGINEEELDNVDWDKSLKQRVNTLLNIISSSTENVRDVVYSYAEQIMQFDDDYGERALQSIVISQNMNLQEYEQIVDAKARAIWLLLESQSAFDFARSARYANQYYHSKFWSGFYINGEFNDDNLKDLQSKKNFEQKLRNIFTKEFPQRQIEFDWFDRLVENESTGKQHFCTQVTIYKEQHARNISQFSESKELKTITLRPVSDGTIVYDHMEQTLDIVIKEKKALRDSIIDEFVDIFSDSKVDIETSQTKNFNLSRLLEDKPLEVQSSDQITKVNIEKLTLSSISSKGFIITVRTRRINSSLYNLSEKHFYANSPFKKSLWKVEEVGLRIEFKPKNNKRAKPVYVELKLPNRSNLRDQTEEHRFITNHLIDRWGLYE